MTTFYPANSVTPHGAYHVFKGDQPELFLKAYDGSIQFFMMGGRSIADRYASPEQVVIPPDGLKGLIPPWQHIEQKGATQDGITTIDALYDPIDVQLTAICRGRDGKHVRQVVRDLIASIDAKQESELGFLSHDMGYWWAPVRWNKGGPPDALAGAQSKKQQLSLRLRADNGFWRSYDDTDSFAFTYESMKEEFTTSYTPGMGPNWPLHYYAGSGGGYPRTRNGQALWIDDPDDPITTQGRSVMFGPYKDFETTTVNQVITIEFGSFQEIGGLSDGPENHIWGRVGRNPDGTWNGDGVRASMGGFGLELSRFNNFVETRMKRVAIFPPVIGEKWSLVCGGEGNERYFQILRGKGNIPVLQHKETGTGSVVNTTHKGVGGGFRAGGALITQSTPASIRKLTAGDNSTVSQSGFLYRENIGDQPMYDDYTLFGPGIFKIWDGPNAGPDDYVQVSLLGNQIVFLRSDPRRQDVQDLSVIPPTKQHLDQFQVALKKFLSFASGNNMPPLFLAIQNQFGIKPPQGNIHSLKKGLFSDECAIPPKSPGQPTQKYAVRVSIDNGNATSRIIASGTPLRRYPL